MVDDQKKFTMVDDEKSKKWKTTQKIEIKEEQTNQNEKN